MKRAVALEPIGAEWQMYLASALSYAGKPGEALSVMKKALRLNPFPADDHLTALCRILYQTGRYEDAIRRATELYDRNPDWREPHIILMASYSALGRFEDARAEYEKYKNIPRRFVSPSGFITYKTPFRTPEATQRLFADLARAGVE